MSARGFAVACLLLGQIAGGMARAEPARASAADDPLAQQLLARALDNFNATRYERVRLTNRQGTRSYEQDLEVWITHRDDGFRVLGRFVKPENVRGTSFLVLPPAQDAGEEIPSQQYFVYLPALERVRRLSGAQRADSFFGTRFSQGDVEPHPPEHYRALGSKRALVDDEVVHEVDAVPLFESGYDRIRFRFAESDHALLRVSQFRDGDPAPIREIIGKREWQQRIGEHVLPSRLDVTDLGRRGTTEAVFYDRRLDPEVPDGWFSTSHLLRTGR